MTTRVRAVLQQRPELAEELYLLASEVVDDFEDYGPVLQADELSEYSEGTTIKRLQHLRNHLIELFGAIG